MGMLAQRAAAELFVELVEDPLSEKGTCHPVPVTGGVNVNGWRWERP